MLFLVIFLILILKGPCTHSVCVRACVCVCVFATSPGKNTGNILQAILQAKFSRQEYWSGLPSPPPGHLPDPGIKALSPGHPALSGGFFTISTTWEGPLTHWKGIKYLMRRNYQRLKKCKAYTDTARNVVFLNSFLCLRCFCPCECVLFLQ